jgi:hypothetical protein
MALPRERVNLLCVFPREQELRVAKEIFETGTDCKFELDPRFSHLPLRICRAWKSGPSSGKLTIGFLAQLKPGSDGCSKRLCEVAEFFTPDLVAMVGVCGSTEDRRSGRQHGCVIIVKKATKMAGIKCKDSNHLKVDATYVDLDSELDGRIASFAESEQPSWLELIPNTLRCPSPRSARDIIIDMLDTNHKMPKKSILEECSRIQKTKEFGAMDTRSWALIINEMLEGPNPWLQVVDEEQCTLKNTHRSTSYIHNADDILGVDRIRAFLGTMGTTELQMEDLSSEISDLKTAMSANSLIAIDQESYGFMKLCRDQFKHSMCVVVKGISETYITADNQLTAFQRYAVCTPAAWLRFFVTTQEQYLFKNIKPVELPKIEVDFKNDKVVRTVLKAVQRYAASRSVAIGKSMGLTMDRIQGLIHNIVEPADQVMVIFEAHASTVGKPRAGQQLLEACQEELDTSTYRDVLSYIQQHKPTST